MFKKIIKRLHLIKSGRDFSSKLFIFLWLFYPKSGLIREVFIKNEDGLFYLPKKFKSVWVVSSYGEEELRDYFNIKKGIFIDVGANVGKYSIMVGNRLKNNGKVISIEPEINNFLTLKENIKLNKLNNVILENSACSEKNGLVQLYLSDYPGQHSIYRKTKHRIKVRSVKLDDLIKKYSLKKVNLIKIDVEGAEIDVLKGAENILKKFKPKIIFECYGENYPKVKALLKKYGYKIKKISKIDYFAEI